MWGEWIWWQEKEKNGQLCAHAPPKKESAEFRRVVEKCSKCLQIIAGAEAKASAVVRYSTQPTTKEEQPRTKQQQRKKSSQEQQQQQKEQLQQLEQETAGMEKRHLYSPAATALRDPLEGYRQQALQQQHSSNQSALHDRDSPLSAFSEDTIVSDAELPRTRPPLATPEAPKVWQQ